jgi:hypothetical protein
MKEMEGVLLKYGKPPETEEQCCGSGSGSFYHAKKEKNLDSYCLVTS